MFAVSWTGTAVYFSPGAWGGGGGSYILVNCGPRGMGPFSNALHPTNFSVAQHRSFKIFLCVPLCPPSYLEISFYPFQGGNKDGGDPTANVNACPWFPLFWSFCCCCLLSPWHCITHSLPPIASPTPPCKFSYTLYNGRCNTVEIHLKIQMIGHDYGCLPCLSLSEASECFR